MKKLTLLFFSLIILSGCEPEKFSQENPFAVMAKKYRNPLDAKLAKERLEDMGLDPYLEYFEIENEGRWHGVFLGAFPTLESMMKGKIDYEDNQGLMQIERINFHQISGNFIPFNYDDLEWEIPEDVSLPIPANSYELLKLLPHQTNLRMDKLMVLDNGENPVSRIESASGMKFDFPRGISPTQIMRNAKLVAEAHYSDELAEQDLVLQAIKLSENHVFGEDIAKDFTQNILGTREYKFEESTPVIANNWEGLAASLSPKQGQKMNYITLVNPKRTWLIFVQAREKFYPLEQLQNFCKQLGIENSSLNYHYVYQSLQKLPQTKSDTLKGFSVETISQTKQNYKLMRKGNVESFLILQNRPEEFWFASSLNLSDENNAEMLFQKGYLEAKRSVADTLQIGENKALLIEERRRDKSNRKYIKPANELQWQHGTHIFTIDNKTKGWLTPEEMKERAELWMR